MLCLCKAQKVFAERSRKAPLWLEIALRTEKELFENRPYRIAVVCVKPIECLRWPKLEGIVTKITFGERD